MASLGRVLQIAGWLWFAVGIVGPMVGYDLVNPFPGLILIFVARAIRTQAARNEPEEESHEEPAKPAPPERPLNTERTQRPAPPSPSPDPAARHQKAGPAPRPESAYVPEPGSSADEDGDDIERENIIERIVLAGRQAGTKESSQERVDLARSVRSEDAKPMSSAEMIAQARKRWDRKT